MARPKKQKPIDVLKELGKLNGKDKGGDEYLSFINEHLKKFNTIPKAEALLWNMNISLVSVNPSLYKSVYEHTKGYNYKNPLTVGRLENLEAFLLDEGVIKN